MYNFISSTYREYNQISDHYYDRLTHTHKCESDYRVVPVPKSMYKTDNCKIIRRNKKRKNNVFKWFNSVINNLSLLLTAGPDLKIVTNDDCHFYGNIPFDSDV